MCSNVWQFLGHRTLRGTMLNPTHRTADDTVHYTTSIAGSAITSGSLQLGRRPTHEYSEEPGDAVHEPRGEQQPNNVRPPLGRPRTNTSAHTSTHATGVGIISATDQLASVESLGHRHVVETPHGGATQ